MPVINPFTGLEVPSTFPEEWDQLYVRVETGRGLRRHTRVEAIPMGKGIEVFLMTPEGSVRLTYLGHGLFAKVYLDPEKDRVYVFSADDCYDKEILDFCYDETAPNPHLPAVESVGSLAESGTVHAMPRYETPLRAAHKTAWAQFRILKQELDAAVARKGWWKRTDWDNYSISFDMLENVKGQIPEALWDALDLLISNAANYGSTYGLELTPRNMATDKDENLVLLDPLFDAEKTRQIRMGKRRRFGDLR